MTSIQNYGISNYSNVSGSHSNVSSSHSNGANGYWNGTSSYSSGALAPSLPIHGYEQSRSGMLAGAKLNQVPDALPPTARDALPPDNLKDTPEVAPAWAKVQEEKQKANAADTVLADAKVVAAALDPNKVFASMLNGMTSTELEQEKAAIERRMLQTSSAEEKAALQEQLHLINAEQKSRPQDFFGRTLDDRMRQAIKNECSNKSNDVLQSELAQLLARCSTSASGITPCAQSNQGVDSELQIRVGAIQAELLSRGTAPVTPESLKVAELTGKAQQAEKDYQTAVEAMRTQEGEATSRINGEADALRDRQAQAAADLRAKQVQVLNELWRNLDRLGGKDKIMSLDDLKKTLNGQKGAISPGLREALEFLLKTQEGKAFFKQLDTAANGGSGDNKISKKDLERMRSIYNL